MNVLVIGDLHEPFCRDGYLEFTKSIQKKYKCDQVVFIGDLIDNHYSSFHATDPDGYGGEMELRMAVEKLQKWYNAYPQAVVCEGNHDALIKRKAFSAGIPSKWIKDYPEMFNTPNWKYGEEWQFDNVRYIHGTGTSGDQAAFKNALYSRKSVVQGHLHSFASVQYTTSENDRLFGMIVGCGVDQKAYAMAYSKTYPRKFIVSCGVVLDGKTAFPVLMDL